MKLKTLTLTNYRKFKHTTIEFPDGIIGVIGLNGVGKSTIFEAIAWVLYGPVAARTPADQIKRNSASSKDSCRVSLEFIFDHDTYYIVREMSGKSLTPSASAMMNGKQMAQGAEHVTRFVQKQLGLDFKSFFTSIFAKQKELNVLSSMNASERRPLILKMLGIDAIDDVIKQVRSDKHQSTQHVDHLQQDIITPEGTPKDEDLKEKIKTLQTQQQENKKIQEQIIKEKKLQEKKLTEKKQVSKKYKQDYEELLKKKEEEEKLQHQLQQKQDLEQQIQQLSTKIKERIQAVKEKEKQKSSLQDPKKEIQTIEQRISTLTIQKEQCVKDIEQQEAHLQHLQNNLDDIKEKKQHIKKMGVEAPCPTCERVLGDQHSILITKYAEEMKHTSQEIKERKKTKTTQEKELERYRREHEALQKKHKYFIGIQQEQDRLLSEIQHLQKEQRQEQQDVEKKQKLLNKNGTIDFDTNAHEKLKKKVTQSYEFYQETLETVDQIKDRINEYQLQLQKKKGDYDLIQEQITNKKEKLQEIKEKKQQLKKEQQQLKHLKLLSIVMTSFRTSLISRIRPTLSLYASEYYEQLTEGKYHQIDLDEQYNIGINDEGTIYNVERFSGGEEDLANLCLRLAISEVITERAGGSFQFIILDEIFGSQDAQRRQNIMQALHSLSSKFRQVFVITHVEDIKHMLEYAIIVREQENNTSMITIE